jgi:hypothetical protein
MRVRARKERNAGGGKEGAGDPKEETKERRQEPPGGSSRAAAAKLAGAGAVAVASSGVACGLEGRKARGVKEPNNARRQRVCAYAWRRKVGAPSILRGKLYLRRGEQGEQGLGRGQGL